MSSRKCVAQEMQGSWLRIACSHRSLSSCIGQTPVAFDDGAEVLLDRALVLRGGWDDAGVEDRALVVDLVAVVEQSARRLGSSVADPGVQLHLDRGRLRRLVGLDQRERLVGGLDELTARTMMLWNGLRQEARSPASAAASRAKGRRAFDVRLYRASGPVR